MHGLVQDKDQGTTGTICETFDGGVTWTQVTTTGPLYATDLSFVPGTSNIWVSSGSNGTNGSSYSFNGGHFWNDFMGTQGAQYMQMTWLNNHCGWAGGISTSATENGVYKFIGVLSIPLPPPVNVNAQVNNQEVSVTWVKPVFDTTTVALLGYNMYRNNIKIATILDPNVFAYNDFDVPSGQYIYCVSSIYIQGESAKTCKDVEVIALGINPPATTADISVYPNPVDNLLHIRSAGTINELQLTDLSGREVFRSLPGNGNVDLPVTSFHSGIYLLSLQTVKGSYHVKVVIR
jgi:hypothetical protein